MIKVRSIATLLLTNLGAILTQHEGNIIEWHYTKRGRFLLEKTSTTLSDKHWLRSWHKTWDDSFNLTVVTAARSWALLVDAICWNLWAWKPPHHVKVGFIEGDFWCKVFLPLLSVAILKNKSEQTTSMTKGFCKFIPWVVLVYFYFCVL